MKSLFAALLLISLPLLAGNVRVDLPGGSGDPPPLSLTYFNGTPYWLTYSGIYRGTWFNINDFLPGGTFTYLNHVQYWFYEHTDYPWDTNQFYSEAWNGDSTSPLALLAQGIVTAPHYAPCYHSFSPALVVGQNFWALINPEMSAGGWPSVLGDNSMPGDAGHSFFSDGLSWEIWELGEYYIGVDGWPNYSLHATTWGSMKALF